MSHVEHDPSAFKAATEVDPLILANALDHIQKTAAKSRTSTRRLRWIEQRALFALRGDEYWVIDLDLPKDPGPNTQEKLKRRMDFHIAVKHAHADALRQLVDVCERMDLHAYRNEVVIVVQSQKALDSLYTDKIKLGGDASFAVWKQGMGTAASLGVDLPWSNSPGDRICGNIRTGRSQGDRAAEPASLVPIGQICTTRERRTQ